MSIHHDVNGTWGRRVRLALIVASVMLAWPLIAQTTLPDLCGCRNSSASFGAFDTRDRNTWPPGTVVSTQFVTIPLPADGVMVFDSMRIEYAAPAIPTCCAVEVSFQRNAANTPVTLLVKGDVTVAGNGYLSVRGANGTNATQDGAGAGGLGGPAGFRGGDGAFRITNGIADGAIGLGPGGGVGGTGSPLTAAGAGLFVGAFDLLPLVGGSGGGGGRSANSVTNCSGGGGGGGGGALLIASNGTITLNNSSGTTGSILADGGNGGSAAGYTCSSGGHGGSGGAVRLIANTIAGGGRILARGGTRWEDAVRAGTGSVRLEAVTNTLGVTFTDPVASRTTTPGPVVNPLAPRVSVTAVASQPVPENPQGVYGGIDIQVPVPGPTSIDLATDGVPVGTVVEVKVKPRIGISQVTKNLTLANCDATGKCIASVTLDLVAGLYTVEARATFQQPAP